jgi:hypothetical protein
LFVFPDLGAFSEADAAKALQDPANAAGVTFETAALGQVSRVTQGYPFQSSGDRDRLFSGG